MSQCEAAESSSQVNPQVIDGKERSPLDEVLRQGARQMLVKAVEAEVTAYIETHQHEVDQDGRRLVVRNGHARERTIVSGVCQLKIQTVFECSHHNQQTPSVTTAGGRHTGGRSRSATCTSSVCESRISARTTNSLMQSADTTYFCV